MSDKDKPLPHTPRELVQAHAHEALRFSDVNGQVHAALAQAWAVADLADAVRASSSTGHRDKPQHKAAEPSPITSCVCGHTREQHHSPGSHPGADQPCRAARCACLDFWPAAPRP